MESKDNATPQEPTSSAPAAKPGEVNYLSSLDKLDQSSQAHVFVNASYDNGELYLTIQQGKKLIHRSSQHIDGAPDQVTLVGVGEPVVIQAAEATDFKFTTAKARTALGAGASGTTEAKPGLVQRVKSSFGARSGCSEPMRGGRPALKPTGFVSGF